MFRHALLFAVLVIGSPLALAQEPSRVYRAPFHSTGGMILLDATVNGKPAALLLDTGAPLSVAFVRDAADRGISCKLHKDGKITFSKEEPLSVAFVTPKFQFDGFLGQDILRKFSAVRIDYKAGVVEFEQ